MSKHKLPPIIDREIFFGNPEIAGGQLSPDGQYISFLKAYNGIMNIYVKAFDVPFEEARVLTTSHSPILGYFWTYDSRYILYINDKDGDENFNIYSVDPQASPPRGEVAPTSTNLTPLEEVNAQIYDVSRKDPDILWVGLNDRDKAWHDLYELKISTGELKLLHQNEERLTGWDFDWNEDPRLAYRSDENGWQEILRIDGPRKFEVIYKTNLQESAYVTGWNKDNSRCYLVSNQGEVNLSTLYLMDPMSGQSEKVEYDPEKKVDFGSLMMDRNKKEILCTIYTLDKTKYYWKNREWEADFKYLQQRFPNREVGISSRTKRYDKWLVAVTGDQYASEVYFFDRVTKEIIHQYTPQPALKDVEEGLSPMEPVHYHSSDGLEIPAYLTYPVGKKRENLPLVVLVHGGPKGPRDYWGYNGLVQFLANRGYAVLQPNFRASGGFGKAFLNAGDKEWGRKMQDDITWGVKHLVSKGIADEANVAIMGGSYGGYATLAGLTFTPELYNCGVDIVGPSNLFTLLGSIPPYWEAGRKWLYEMVGDPDTEEGQKLLNASSPLFHVENISRPLMIIQGANDPRVKQAESDQIAVALREKGKDVVYLNAQDEGHGFRKPINRMAMYAEIEKFLAEHIGGRYQKNMPDEVKSKLEDLWVDVDKITLDQ